MTVDLEVKVVEGMVATAAQCMKESGRQLLDTGTSDAPFKGEEIDWVGDLHVD